MSKVKCAGCSCGLVDDYAMRNGEPYCRRCAAVAGANVIDPFKSITDITPMGPSTEGPLELPLDEAGTVVKCTRCGRMSAMNKSASVKVAQMTGMVCSPCAGVICRDIFSAPYIPDNRVEDVQFFGDLLEVTR